MGVMARWNRRCCGRSGTAVSAPAPEECFLLVSVARGILGGGRATRPPVGEWDPKLSGGGETRIYMIILLYFFLLFFLWALGPRRPRLGFGVLKDTFPIRWSPWARFLPVQLIRSAWQSAWHINFPRTRCVSPMTPDHYYAVVDRMLCMR